MNIIHKFLSDQVLQALGWTFVHSLWQGAIIALILGIMLPGLKKRAATVRYALAVGSLAALFALSVTTFVRYYTGSPAGSESDIRVTAIVSDNRSVPAGGLDAATRDEATSHVHGIAGYIKGFTDNFTRYFPLVVSLWLLGMTLFLAKMLGGLIYSERFKFTGIKSIPDPWKRNFAALKTKMNINRPVKLVESCMARVPMVIGYIKPVVLIPLGILAGLPKDQVEAIIAHELAHIRRNDFLINIFQSLFESIFFYHPAVWWISSVIRKEREHCCDDLAVSVCQESMVYARALANLQERFWGTPFYAVALTKKRYSLLSRIKRLNPKPVSKTGFTEKWITLAVMTMIVAFLSVSLRIRSSDEALAAVNPVQEMTFGFKPVSNGDLSHAPLPELQDTLKKPGTSTINTTFFDAADQKEKKVKMVFEQGEVKELYIDGEKVPEEEMGKYQELIDDTLAELREAEIELEKAQEELQEAERSLEDIDFERINREMEKARQEMERTMQQMKEIDMEKISREMEQAHQKMMEAMEKIEWSDFEEKFQQMQVEIEQFRHDFDTTEITRELQRNLEEIKRNMKDFNRDYMHEIRKEMEEARRSIHETMEELNRILDRRMEESREFREMERESRRLEEEAMYLEQERQERQEIRLREMEFQRQSREAERQEMDARRQATEAEEREREATLRERKAIEREREANVVMQMIEEQLVKDGFFDEGEPIDFELSVDKLLINGKKQPQEVFEFYKQLYEQYAGTIPEKSTILIKK